MHVEVVLERLIAADIEFGSVTIVNLLNKLALALGLLSSLGMSMVANFQVTNVSLVHTIGALMAFVLGALYGGLITTITIIIFVRRRRQQMRRNSSSFLWRSILLISVRFLLTLTSATALVLFIVYDKIASGFQRNSAHWDRDRPGWMEHTISTTAEWASCSMLFIFISTFAFDFQAHRVKRPRMHRSSERARGSRGGRATGTNAVHKMNIFHADGHVSDSNSVDSCDNLSAPALTVSDRGGFNFSVV